MPSQDPAPEQPFEKQVDQTFAQKVEALQERLREMGFVPDASGDKVFMDEAWGEER